MGSSTDTFLDDLTDAQRQAVTHRDGALLVLAFSVPFAVLMAIWETAIIFLLPGILVVSPFIYRLMLKLPAIALERTDFLFGDAWAATSGNYWQIMGLVTVYTIVALALNLLFTFVSGTALLAGVFGTLLGSAAGAAPRGPAGRRGRPVRRCSPR